MAFGWTVPPGNAAEVTARQTALAAVRLGTGTVARGWTVPAGPEALPGPASARHAARVPARRGTGTLTFGCTVPDGP